MNSLPKTVTRQRRGCDLNPGPSEPESSTLTTRLPTRSIWNCTKKKNETHRFSLVSLHHSLERHKP